MLNWKKQVDEKLAVVSEKVNEKIDKFRKEVYNEICQSNIEKNFVIRNLPEGRSEKVLNNVNGVLKMD